MNTTLSIFISIISMLAGNPEDGKFATASLATEDKMEVFSDNLCNLYEEVGLAAYNLDYEAFEFGMIGYLNLKDDGKITNSSLLTIIDYTKSANEKRFYTINLDSKKVLYHTYVAHGENTGGEYARYFSNRMSSHQTSIGFYITGETYRGKRGFSLKLDGAESGINHNMRRRGLVVHGANYVSENYIQRNGRLGRSWGCPSLPSKLNAEVINTIKGGTLIFGYSKDKKYYSRSNILSRSKALKEFFEPIS